MDPEGKNPADLVKSGKNCVALTESDATVSSDASEEEDSSSEAAEKSVSDIEKCASELASHAEQMATNVKKQAEEYQEQAEEIQKETATLSEREKASKASVKKKKESLAKKEAELKESLRIHSREHNEAREREDVLRASLASLRVENQLQGASCGIRGGFFCPEETEILNYANNQLKLEISSLEHHIQMEEIIIDMLSQQIESKEKECQKQSDEAKHIKEDAVFFRRASVFWKEIQQITEHGGERYTNTFSEAKVHENGDVTKASRELKELEEYAGDLANHAEKSATKATQQTEEHQRQAEEIQSEVASLHERENVLRARIENKKTSLYIKKFQLLRAQYELDNAKSRLRNAFPLIVGGFIGNLRLLYSLFWTCFWTRCELNEIIDAGTNAILSDVIKRENQINSFNTEMNSLRCDIQKMEGDIQTLSQQITIKERERQKKSNEAKGMKEEAVFFRRAAVFWKEFQQISEHGGDRAALFQKILDKAKEIKTFEFHKNNEMKRIAMSFIDAWEAMVVKYSDKEGQRLISREDICKTLP